MSGTNSTCIWFAGRNTGAPQVVPVPSDCEKDPEYLVAPPRGAGGINFSPGYWGRSDVLRGCCEGPVKDNSRISGWDGQYVHGKESAFR